MANRYEVKSLPSMWGNVDVIVDTETLVAGEQRELCPAASNEAPEDASVYRTFSPLLDECNSLAAQVEELKRRVRELENDLEAHTGPYF